MTAEVALPQSCLTPYQESLETIENNFFCCFQASYQALEALNTLFLIEFSPGTKVFVLLRCKCDPSKYFHDIFQFL